MVQGQKLPFAKHFWDLMVYRKAYAVSLEIHRASLEFPKIEQFGGIADQMRRASKGICANIAEGHGKNAYGAEWRRFLMMALGSSQEMMTFSQYAVDLGYVHEEKAREWWQVYTEIAKMIQGLLVRAGEKAA